MKMESKQIKLIGKLPNGNYIKNWTIKNPLEVTPLFDLKKTKSILNAGDFTNYKDIAKILKRRDVKFFKLEVIITAQEICEVF